LIVIFLSIGSISRWKKTSMDYLKSQLLKVAVASVLLGIVIPLAVTREVNVPIFIAVALALWIILGIGRDFLTKTANKASLLEGLKSLSLSYYGMQIAHLGIAVIILGVCLTSHYSIEEDVRLAPGEQIEIGKYTFTFQGVNREPGPNYAADVGTIEVQKKNSTYMTLYPEKRTYFATGTVQTEADIDVGFTRDLFAALGDPRGDGAWVVRLHVKPFVFWIWMGAFLMAAGGITAILDRRYRVREVRQQETVTKTPGAMGSLEGA